VSYGTWGNPPQDVNIVNPANIKAIVHAAFYPPPGQRAAGHGHKPSARAVPATIDVYNGGSTYHLAKKVADALVGDGYRRGKVGNTAPRATTLVRYAPGEAANARKIAKLLGGTATPSASVAAGHVVVLLGASATVPSATPTASPSSTPLVIPTTGPQGGVVRTGRYGIPCVN